MGTAADQKETPRERLAALARLLIQLRFLLTGVALLLSPRSRSPLVLPSP